METGKEAPLVRHWAPGGLALIVVGLFALLSWPVDSEPTYWAVSPAAWAIYGVLAMVLGVYVFVEFLDSIRLLSRHAHHDGDGNGSPDH